MKTIRFMDFAKIRDSDMFEGGRKERWHWYSVERDSRGKTYLRQVNHLYQYDPERKRKLDRGFGREFRADFVWTPSMLKNDRRYQDVHGNDLDSASVDDLAVAILKGVKAQFK